MPRATSLPSIRTELLLKLGILTAFAILLAVSTASLLIDIIDPSLGRAYLATLVLLDVTIFLGFGAYLVQQLVVLPLHQAIAAAEAIAAGDLQRRVPAGASRELDNLAVAFNCMTDRVLEEQAQLVRAEKLASVGRLAAGVAHEVGNPLGAIAGYVHLLRAAHKRLDAGEEVTSSLDGVEREADRIDRIVRGLLEYARPRPPAPMPIEMNDVATSVVELLRMQGTLKGIDVSVELAANSPYVHGQRHDLEQVFVNLMLNACDVLGRRGRLVVRVEPVARIALREPQVRRAVAPGEAPVEHPPSPRAQAWLASHDAAEVARIIIADSGPGVAPELTERIFEPFFTTKPPGRGTGLGLAIVARIVDNFRGTVWVTRAREGGAAFHVLFPIAPGVSTTHRNTLSVSSTTARLAG